MGSGAGEGFPLKGVPPELGYPDQRISALQAARILDEITPLAL